MPGIHPGAMDPSFHTRIKHYEHVLIGADPAVARRVIVGVVRLPVGKKGRIINQGLLNLAAASGTGNITFTMRKVIAAGNGRAAANEKVPINCAAAATQAVSAAAQTLTTGALAPDDREISSTLANGGQAGAQAGAAGSITLHANAHATDNSFYVNSLVKNLATGEVRVINGYTAATRVATVTPNWVIANPAAGTPYVILHDNLIVSDDDFIEANCTAVGAGDKGVEICFFADVLELSDINDNNYF